MRHRERFDLFISGIVLLEAGRGDPEAAARRLAALNGIGVLDLTDRARDLAGAFLARRVVPAQAVDDALHVAVATVEARDFLLTWNCRHIANAEIMEGLRSVCAESGYRLPVLCTPEQLMGD